MKMSFTNEQVAFEYALYMIAGSYFEATSCSMSRIQEKKMFLNYMEQKKETQYKMEESCLSFVEKKLLSKVPEGIWRQKVEVRVLKRKEEDKAIICFVGEDFVLAVKGEYLGKGGAKIKFMYRGCRR